MTIKEDKFTLLEKLENKKAAIAEKFNTNGYVVAGYGGDTFYTYVGKGNGYKGTALTPIRTVTPVVFQTEESAMCEVNNGTYSNGHGHVIRLKVLKASEYFAKIYDDIERNIKFLKGLFFKEIPTTH